MLNLFSLTTEQEEVKTTPPPPHGYTSLQGKYVINILHTYARDNK